MLEQNEYLQNQQFQMGYQQSQDEYLFQGSKHSKNVGNEPVNNFNSNDTNILQRRLQELQ